MDYAVIPEISFALKYMLLYQWDEDKLNSYDKFIKILKEMK